MRRKANKTKFSIEHLNIFNNENKNKKNSIIYVNNLIFKKECV